MLWESKQTLFFVEIVYNKCQNLSTFAIFNTQPLWILIQGWEQGQESHYIQPSNLSSALIEYLKQKLYS